MSSTIEEMLDSADALPVAPKVSGNQQAVVTTYLDDPENEARPVAAAAMAKYGLTVNNAAKTSAGTNGAGESVVLYALKRAKTSKVAAASVTFYRKGSVVWAGCDPIDANGDPISLN